MVVLFLVTGVRQKEKIYWYYKLHATKPQFPKASDAKVLSKYKHLGKAGSSEHIDSPFAHLKI